MYSFLFAIFFVMPTDSEVEVRSKFNKSKYEGALKYYGNWSKNLDNPDFWKNTEFKDKKTGKIKKFSDLTDEKKSVFFLLMCENLTEELRSLQQIWNVEIKKMQSRKEKSGDDKFPTLKEVQDYSVQMLKIRKETAVKFEKMAKEILKKNKVPEKELQLYMKRIERYHDMYNLIKREKCRS